MSKFLSKSTELHPVTSYQAYCRIERQRDLLIALCRNSLMLTDQQKEDIINETMKLQNWLTQYKSHVTVKFDVPCSQEKNSK